MQPLPRSFFMGSAAEVAPLLLGHFLLRRVGADWAGGIIVETEAYHATDPASHSFKGKTPRNASMWGEAGHAYVYLIYGYHFCVNAVCRPAGHGEAVLIRAIEPTFGAELLQRNRPVNRARDLTNGPAKLCQALGIDRSLDGVDLCSPGSLMIAENPRRAGQVAERGPVVQTRRVGITRAVQEPLRWFLGASNWVSRAA